MKPTLGENRTRKAIARMRGKVKEDTAWVVAASTIDIEGFYSGSPLMMRQPSTLQSFGTLD